MQIQISFYKKVVRIISGIKYRDPFNPVFNKIKILKFKDVFNLSILKLMYKAHQNCLPYKIQNKFTKIMNNYNLKDHEIFSLPTFRKKIKER